MTRRLLPVLLGLAVATPVFASEPTPAQAREVEALLGLDAALPTIVAHAMPADAGADWTDEQRKCVLDTFTRALDVRLQASLARGFVSGENIEAWKAFDRTAGGHKLIQLFGRTVSASVSGSPLPDVATEAAKLSPEEQADIARFMATPAAKVLDGELIPGFASGDNDAEAIAKGITTVCGVDR